MLYDDADTMTAHHLLNNENVVWHTSVTNSSKAKHNCLAFVELPMLKMQHSIYFMYCFIWYLYMVNYRCKSRGTFCCSIACLRYCIPLRLRARNSEAVEGVTVRTESSCRYPETVKEHRTILSAVSLQTCDSEGVSVREGSDSGGKLQERH